MAYDRAASIAAARRVVHDTMAIAAEYRETETSFPVLLRVRWQNKLAINGNLVEGGWSEQIEGINSLVFDGDELNEKGINLKRGGRVTLTDDRWNGAVLILDSLTPDVGPLKIIWRVVAP